VRQDTDTHSLERVRSALDDLGWVDDGEKNYFDQQYGRYAFTLRYLSTMVRPGQCLLDVGSHVLHLGMALSDLGYQVCGTDVDLFVAHPRNKPRQERFGIRDVRACDLSKDALPYEDSTFDVVNFAETLEHLNFNPLPVFKELHRVLKPQGILLVTTPNALRIGSRLRFLRGQNVFADLENLCFGDPYSAHYREYTLAEVAQLLKWTDFVVSLQQVRYFHRERGIRERVRCAIEVLVPTVAGNLFLVGSKY
jgi:SAM-dependent methyltransferase